jgi:hypothetical protein
MQRRRTKSTQLQWKPGEVERVSTPNLYILLTTQLGRVAYSRPGEFTFYERISIERHALHIAQELRKRGDQLSLV